MKKQFILTLGLVALAMTNVSCDLDSESNHTPDIIPFIPYVINDTDTLKFTYDKDYDLFLDTICMGDTVQFAFQFGGYYNNITRIEVDCEEAYGRIINLPADTLNQVFDANPSDYDDGEYVMSGEYVSVILPFQYYPTQVGDKGEIEIYVESDADFDANKRVLEFSIPVIAAKE